VKEASSSKGVKPRRRRRKGDEEKEIVGSPGDGDTANESSKVDDDDDDAGNNDEDDSLSDDDDDEEGDGNAEGWDLTMLRSNMFAFLDGDGNLVFEKIEDDDDDGTDQVGRQGELSSENESDEEEEEEKEEEEEEKEEEKEDAVQDNAKRANFEARGGDTTAAAVAVAKPSKVVTSSQVMTMNAETGSPEAVFRSSPLPRIKAGFVVRGNVLYLFGGLLEVGDREVTLDDCWSLDLRKRDQWNCLWPGTMHKQVWRGAIHDDDDSYISGSGGGIDDDEDDDDEVEDDEMWGLTEEELAAVRRDRKYKAKQSGLRQEIAELKQKLNLDEPERTPQMGEAMADFYTRTSTFWTDQAAKAIATTAAAATTENKRHQNEALSHKELKREGFALAQQRFEELKPLLQRLDELELQQREAEAVKKARKFDKKEKEKAKKKKKKK